jgi:hypothetical protein
MDADLPVAPAAPAAPELPGGLHTHTHTRINQMNLSLVDHIF